MAMLRARYGAKDNGHALLWQSDSTIKLPTALLGLTDRPQGYEQPREHWWPSVGCAPLGEYWAIWWTLPDNSAQRGGMARSEVALLPLAEIGTLPDLIGVLQELSGAPVAAASPERLSSLAEAVLNLNDGTPAVLGLEDWPGLLAGLWPRLSPSMRRQFSARVALTPPQSGQSVAEPWMYGAPSGRRLQWSGRPKVEMVPLQASRAAQWLAGQPDAMLEDVLAAYGPDWPDLAALRRAARGAEGLKLLRSPFTALEVPLIISLLRTLVTLPDTEATNALQQEAIAGIATHLPVADYQALKSLANIHLPADAARPLVRSVVKWMENRVLTLALADAGDLLSRAVKNELEAWWRQGVCEALRLGFTQPHEAWHAQTLRWLGLPPAHPALDELLPSDFAIELGLLSAAEQTALSDVALQACQAQCGRRNWSRLHARILHKGVAPKLQLSMQLAFPGDVKPGLIYLVDALPGDIVLAQTLATPEPPLLPLVAERTRQQPGLLDKLDPRQASWRSLWVAHIQAGGSHWPPGAGKEQLTGQLVDAVLEGADADALVAVLAGDLADTVLTNPKRSEIWPKLGREAQSQLAAVCSRRFIQSLQGMNQAEPEKPLSQAILSHVEAGPRSLQLIVTVANWASCTDENVVCRWVEQSLANSWTKNTEEALGNIAAHRRWHRLAALMYNKCTKNESKFAFGLAACLELLNYWPKAVFSALHAPTAFRAIDRDALVRRVAELGADLAPHDALEYWERAGGRRKDINGNRSPSQQWQDMAHIASKGGIEGNLTALVAELSAAFPRNADVNELQAILRKSDF